LPKNLPSPPTYRKVNPADSPILLLSATSDTLPLTTVSDAVDAQLAQQISQISGVAHVIIGGQLKPAIRIQIDPAKLVAKGLSLEDVRSQIAITTVDSTKGNIDGERRAYTIYATDTLPTFKDWNDVIIAYLRSFWATAIPAVSVPLALLGACALMWVFGYSLDNRSLMALTIAVGFVVDDAIVMLENITRYIEEGEKPLAAAFKGASEIGFTIVSISVSLVAVLIPLLLMGGIIGRLFREFAVTLAMTIFVSMVVSVTLTPMMASRFLRAHDEVRHGKFYQWSERAFDGMLHAYERGLDRALRWKLTTLLIFFATLGLSVYLFVVIPKGFFPQQDNGLITATS